MSDSNWQQSIKDKSEILMVFDIIPSCELGPELAKLVNHCVKHRLIINDVDTSNYLYVVDGGKQVEVNNDFRNKAKLTFKKLEE